MSRQKLGQHFLASGKALQRIVAAAASSKQSLAVEIGPGKGALTQHLLDKFERVVAIELDPVLAQHLRDRWPREPRLEIMERNALGVPFLPFGEGVLVGNLPYYVSTAIVSNFVRAPGRLTEAVFLIQKEVAERCACKPGSKEYGILSVFLQAYYKVEYLFDVDAESFTPPPKIMSGVIRLTKRKDIPAMKSESAFFNLVKTAFNQRRKTLRNAVKGLFEADFLKDDFFNKRAEVLTVEDFAALTFRMK